MTGDSTRVPSPFERDLREEVELFLAGDPSLLDQKIMANTGRDLRKAFSLLAQVEGRPKVTIFGSARTASHDPLYEQTVRVARELAAKGWMVITGAGQSRGGTQEASDYGEWAGACPAPWCRSDAAAADPARPARQVQPSRLAQGRSAIHGA